jgi:hypothetical protein
MLNLFDEFRAIIDVLEKEKFDYAICGGMAMAIHGFLRATIDIDVVLLNQDIPKLKIILRDKGYLLESNPMQLGNGDTIIHRITKVDKSSEDYLMLDILEVTEALQEVWQNRKRIDWNFGSISVVNKAGLIFMKTMRNSKVDQADIERLEAHE